MAMQIDASVTGGQIGDALARDPEELWYALREISEIGDLGIGYVAEYAHGRDAENVTKFLRKLAAAIEGEAEQSR